MNNTKEIRSDKGITIVVLIITVVVMLIITSMTINTSLDRFEINDFNKMKQDIELLANKVDNYYLKYNGIPVIRNANNKIITYTVKTNFEKYNNVYYILDLNEMESISLNYGREGYELIKQLSTQVENIEENEENNDLYIINNESRNIYYVRGIQLDGEIYNTNYYDEQIEDVIPPSKPEIRVVYGALNSEGVYNSRVDIEILPGKDNYTGTAKTVYSINNGEEKEITTLTNNIYTIEESGTYIIKAKSEDENGNKSEEVEKIVKVERVIRKNLTAYSQNSSIVELEQAYQEKIVNLRIYGNAGGVGDKKVNLINLDYMKNIQNWTKNTEGTAVEYMPIELEVGELYTITVTLQNSPVTFSTSGSMSLQKMKGITSFEYILNFTQEPVGVKKCSFIATGEEVFTIYSPNWTTQSELDKLLTEDISNISIQKGTKTVASELIGKYEIPISIEINEESENLFELSEFESGTMNSSTGVNLNTTNRARSNYIYLEKGNYTISSIGEVQSIPRFHKYRDMTTSTWIEAIPITIETLNGEIFADFTLDEDCYVRFAFMPVSGSSITGLSKDTIWNYNPKLIKKTNLAKEYIYLNEPLYEGDYLDFKTGKIIRKNGREEKIQLPELAKINEHTKITIGTENIPSKIEVEYLGYVKE